MEKQENGVAGVRGLVGANDVTITSDGKYVLATANTSDAISVFLRNSTTGKLQFVQVLRNNIGGTTGLKAPSSIFTLNNKTYASSLGQTGFSGGVVVFDNNTTLPAPSNLISTFDGIEGLSITTASGDDTIKLQNAPNSQVATTTINTNGGNDTVVLDDLSVTTRVNLGNGDDQALLRSTRANTNLIVNGDANNDTIAIEQAGNASRTEVFGGDGADIIKVAGGNLPTSATTIVHGNNPIANPGGDTLLFDPQNRSYTPTTPLGNSGTISVIGRGTVTYDTIENPVIVAPPVLTFTGTPYQINEGQSATFTVNVSNPLGTAIPQQNILWDIDGDGRFGDVTGSTVSLSWNQLRDFKLDNNGSYKIAVQASNTSGSSTASTTLIIANTNPTLTLAGNNSINVGAPYTLNFSASDPVPSDRILEWQINWGDGTPVEKYGSGVTFATHIFITPGNPQITVAAIDNDSNPNVASTTSKTIAVSITSIQISAGTSYRINEGESLQLSATADGNPTAYQWDINGDGIFGDAVGKAPIVTWATLQNLPTNLIRDNGTFNNVRVRVAYGLTQVTSNPVSLIVGNTAPTATFTNSGAVNEGGNATVSFSNQVDPSLADTIAGFRYSYDFNNDGTFETTDSTQSSVSVPIGFLKDSGISRVRAVIKDKDGGSSELFTDIIVNEVAPTLIVTGNNTAIEGANYTLNLSATDPGNDTVSQWQVDWNDGTVQTFNGATQSLTHSFGDNGSKVISIKAMDDNGSYNITKTVAVSNVAPTIQSLVATTINEGGTTRFTGKIIDPGTADSFTLLVNWGDGSTAESFNFAAGTTNFDLAHQYLDNPPTGNYTISAGITDKDGDSSSGNVSVTVINAAPTIAGLGLTSANVDENGIATVVGIISDLGIFDTHTVAIAWGDGSTTTNISVNSTTRTFTASHTYLDNLPTGKYAIIATATDKDGGVSAIATTSVQVNNVAPLITSLSLSAPVINENGSVTLNGTFTDVGSLDTQTAIINWGDGSTSNATVNLTTGTFTANHQYLDDLAGTSQDKYTITATVTDDDGGSGINTTTITVNNVAPTVDAGTNQTIKEGDILTFAGNFSDVGTLDTQTIAWDFGNGIKAIDTLKPIYTYTQSGTYTVTLTITDDDGGVTSDSLTVIVNSANQPPVVTPPAPAFTVNSLPAGTFIVNSSGQVTVDFLADGGGNKGELAIFSLEGMEALTVGSTNFIKEAARRALTSSELGYVVISDATQGAKFSGQLGELDRNDGSYLGPKTVLLKPGTRFALIFIPNGKVQEAFNNPAIGGDKRPLFSISAANPSSLTQMGQLDPGNFNGGVFGFEDARLDGSSDKDYNDFIFQVKGAAVKGSPISGLIAQGKNWQTTTLGQQLLQYAQTTGVFGNAVPQLRAALVNDTGISQQDGITSDVTVTGSISSLTPIVQLQASLLASNNYVDILSQLKPDGSFVLNRQALAQINGEDLHDGSYTLQLKAMNVWQEVVNVSLNFILDTQAPSAPTNLGVDKLNVNTPFVKGEAEVTTLLELSNQNGILGQTLSQGSWQVKTTTLTDGVQQVSVKAVDAAGNVSLPSTLQWQIDTSLPTLTVSSPANNIQLQPGAKLQGTFKDTGLGIASLTYELGTGNQIPVSVNQAGEFDQELNLSGLTNDISLLTLTGIDLAGNVTTKTLQVQVN